MPSTKPDKTKKPVKARILERYCKSCGLCVSVCAKNGIYISDEFNEMGYQVAKFRDDTQCTGCCNCAAMCPDAAIEIVAIDDDTDAQEDDK